MGAFVIWGLIPLYFKSVDYITATELVAFRVVFAIVVLVALLGVLRGREAFHALSANKRVVPFLALSAVLLACNWLTFTWAVTQARVLETSLGYFINPLVSVVLGIVVLGERLRPAAVAAVLIASAGVLYRVFAFGAVPWVALTVAFSFGFYGLLRKRIAIDSLSGLLVEMMVLLPLAAGYAVYLSFNGESHFMNGGWQLKGWLLLLGPFTVAPLGLFAAGARRINLSTLGFLQYIAPSITFIIAIFLFHESFDMGQLITFVCIWAALIIYSLDAVRANRLALVAEEAN